MKKNIIALAIASAVAAPAAFAAAPTVYGQAAVSIDSVTDAGMVVADNNSRLGVKGSEDLGNGLTAVYKMEFAVQVGDALGLKGRNAYVGLAGGFGTVLLGRHDTPFKFTQASDLFNDGAADNGKVDGSLGMDGAGGEVRANNVLAYVSPSFSGVKIIAAGVSVPTLNDKASLTNVTSIALTYGSKKEGVYLAAATNNWGTDVTGAKAYTEQRLSAQYAAGALVTNVMYQSFSDGASTDAVTEGSNIQLNAGYTMGKMTPKFKYSTVDFADTRKSGTYMGLGLDYALGKKTTTYVEYVSADKNVSGIADKSKTTVSLGLTHKF